MTSYTTEKRRVEGLGSARHGAGTWIKERVSSIFLVPLTVWAVCSVTEVAGEGYAGARAWMEQPLNAVLLALLVLGSIYHMHLGMRVIVEDYIHKTFSKGALLMINLFVCLGLAAAATFAIAGTAITALGAF